MSESLITGENPETHNSFPLNNADFQDWLSQRKLTNPVFVGESFNHVFLAKHPTYGQVVIRFWKEEKQMADSLGIIDLQNSGYMATGKYRREKELLDVSRSKLGKGPLIYETGQIAGRTEWCIESKLEGVSLDKLWPELNEEKRLKVLEQVGLSLSQVHQSYRFSDSELIRTYWLKKVQTFNNNLEILNIFSTGELNDLNKVVNKGLRERIFIGSSFMGTTHFEVILKHVFVSPQDLSINGFVDWETGELKGDQMCDLAYTTFWNSNEGTHRKNGTDLSNPQYFDAIFNGYSTFLSIDKAELMEKLPIYDLLWYMNILWIRALQGENVNTQRRKIQVLEIAESLK